MAPEISYDEAVQFNDRVNKMNEKRERILDIYKYFKNVEDYIKDDCLQNCRVNIETCYRDNRDTTMWDPEYVNLDIDLTKEEIMMLIPLVERMRAESDKEMTDLYNQLLQHDPIRAI